MLQFFRKYQRYFFIVVTVIIVLSFSFFGTYSTIETVSHTDKTAFVAVDGKDVRISDLESMAVFLQSDTAMKKAFAGQWGPNFLNDGVITNDFLKTGLAAELVAQYGDSLAIDLESRLKREKTASFYVHPSARFLTADSVWSYFAPEIKKNLDSLRQSTNPVAPAAFQARTQLYLAEQQFPAPILGQVLRYQEQQYNWLTPDPNLQRTDLALFGYHTFEDWFGPRFIRLVSEFIINSAKIAQAQGYKVSTEEALADLIAQAETSLRELGSRANLASMTPRQYMNEQLRRMGMDESRAARIWQQVLLFRRLFDGVGNAIFVDPLTFDLYTGYALETVEGNMYQLPESLRLPDFRALQKFEAYLAAVSAKGTKKQALDLPAQFLTVEEMQKAHPELVQKRYLLQVAEANKQTLQGLVPIKDMWAWETQDANWEALKKEFPELATKKAATVTERFKVLDALDATTRARVDEHARNALVDTHPQWLEKALDAAKPEAITLSIRMKGGTLPLQGIDNREAFISLLDAAPIKSESTSKAEIFEKLKNFTGDNRNYYRIEVIDRSPKWEVLTFEEASKDDTLNNDVLAAMGPFYEKVRSSDAEKYRKGDGWKPLADVQDLVAADYYKDLITAIEKEHQSSAGTTEKDSALGSQGAAAYRMLSYMRQVRDKLQKNPEDAKAFLAIAQPKAEMDKLAPAKVLTDQWKLTESPFTLRRSDDGASMGREIIFSLKPNEWSDVISRPTGELWFFQLKNIGPAQNSVMAGQAILKAQAELADEGQRILMTHVLTEIKNKNAITFNYLERDEAGANRRATEGGKN